MIFQQKLRAIGNSN